MFVHLDPDDPPDDLDLAVPEIPDGLKCEAVEAARLPMNWRNSQAPPALTRFGDQFAQRAAHCLLLVPSVLAPGENNCLINPAHGEYKKIVARHPEPLHFDPRMFRKNAVRTDMTNMVMSATIGTSCVRSR
jgi:RES domain-containing protein